MKDEDKEGAGDSTITAVGGPRRNAGEEKDEEGRRRKEIGTVCVSELDNRRKTTDT